MREKRVAMLLRLAGRYGEDLLAGAADYASRHDNWVLWVGPGITTIEPIRQWKADGILGLITTRELLEEVTSSRIPTVSLSSTLPHSSIPHVHANNWAIGRMAAEHLLERGFKNFAYIGPSYHHGSTERQRGFEDTLRQAGLGCRCLDLSAIGKDRTSWSFGSGEMRQWVRELPKPIGVFVFNDTTGFYFTQACAGAIVRIPEEIALVCVDDDEVLCRMCRPPLSSVHVPWRRVGYEAAAALDRLMSGRRPPARPILIEPTGVTVRQSSDILAVEDVEVARALGFIRQHAAETFAVSDVASHVALSQRVLERRFRKSFGRTIIQMIRDARLSLAKKELASTDRSIKAVAEACGFCTSSRFVYVFRKEVGLTPVAFRRGQRHASQPEHAAILR